LKKNEIDKKDLKQEIDLEFLMGNGEDIDEILKSYGMEPLAKTNRFWKNTGLTKLNH
jgi:hypothetical protein